MLKIINSRFLVIALGLLVSPLFMSPRTAEKRELYEPAGGRLAGRGIRVGKDSYATATSRMGTRFTIMHSAIGKRDIAASFSQAACWRWEYGPEICRRQYVTSFT